MNRTKDETSGRLPHISTLSVKSRHILYRVSRHILYTLFASAELWETQA
jgi:hypothetical protein